MHRVSTIAATTTRLVPGRELAQTTHGRTAPPAGRSIVAVEPCAGDTGRYISGRPYAPFVAQLIATDRKLPQTRLRRRAAPAESISAYEDAVERIPRDAGRHMRRSI